MARSPKNVAVPGGDPSLVSEGVPRYDNVFVIMLENHSVGPTPLKPGLRGARSAASQTSRYA